MRSRFLRQIRSNIVAGVLIMLPLVTTLYVLFKIFGWVDSILPSFLHAILPVLPEQWIIGTGALLTFFLAYFIGLAAKNYFGRVIIETGNAIISSIPLLNKLYLGVQQIVDAVAGHNKSLFEKAVLIEYPKKNSYCIAFMTSESGGEIARKTGHELVSVFVPTTPNPTSGFLLYLPKNEVIELEMDVETAVKTVMSAGVINPEHIKKTNRLYTLPPHLKNWNWLRIFRRGDKNYPLDPRD
jgi:uncharacterized membrane protein